MVRGYKVFNADWICDPTKKNPFKYEVGKIYIHEGDLIPCKSGFHFCKKLNDCFNYYDFNPNNKVAEVIAHGQVIDEDTKSVTDKIEIIKKLSWHEVLDLVNTGSNNTGINNSGNGNSGNYNSGNRNSGYSNSGNYNSGNYNSGNYNSGNYNSGNRNSGNYNSGRFNKGNYNTGDFNKNDGEYTLFGKSTNITREEFQEKFGYLFYNLVLTEYKDDKLITYTYEEMWSNWFKTKTQEDISLLKTIPNFNEDDFYEITGIKL